MSKAPESCRDRQWLDLRSTDGLADTFTVMSYNILCQHLIRRSLFPYASKGSLKWHLRKDSLLEELLHWSPTILCLQEMSIEHWHQHFSPHLTSYNHQFHFSMSKTHGVSISWSRQRFLLMDQMKVNLDDKWEVLGETLNTDNVALVVALKSQDKDGGVIVVNTHLHWKPEDCYERLQQQWVVLKKTEDMKRKYPSYAVIVCGDFNTTPDDAGYQLMCRKRPVRLNQEQLDNLLPVTEEEDKEDRKEDLEKEAKRLDEELERDQERVKRLAKDIEDRYGELVSCYGGYAYLDPTYKTDQWEGEPIYTNYTGWKGTLDYIFYGPERLKATQVLSLPAEDRMKPGLPNNIYASDHVSLMSKFETL